MLVSGWQHVLIVCTLQKGTRDENENEENARGCVCVCGSVLASKNL